MIQSTDKKAPRFLDHSEGPRPLVCFRIRAKSRDRQRQHGLRSITLPVRRMKSTYGLCCILLAKSNNLSHQLGADLISHVAPTCENPANSKSAIVGSYGRDTSQANAPSLPPPYPLYGSLL